jgi:hypothetical protein
MKQDKVRNKKTRNELIEGEKWSRKPVRECVWRRNIESSVADPNPDLDPQDPHVFGPSGSGFGFISQMDSDPSIIKQK